MSALQADDRIEERDRLGHERDHFARLPQLGEGVDLDEAQPVAGILAADQAVQGQAHPLDVDVEPVVTHRAAHVQEHGGGALGRVAGAVDDDVFRAHPQGQARDPSRSMALMSEPGMSMLASESPNS